MNFNPDTVKKLAGLLQLLEEVIDNLKADIEEGNNDSCSLAFKTEKYKKLIEQYNDIAGLR